MVLVRRDLIAIFLGLRRKDVRWRLSDKLLQIGRLDLSGDCGKVSGHGIVEFCIGVASAKGERPFENEKDVGLVPANV